MNAPAAGLPAPTATRLALLRQVERKLLWLSSWAIHNANHVRPNRDGLKVGGHQASCASRAGPRRRSRCQSATSATCTGSSGRGDGRLAAKDS